MALYLEGDPYDDDLGREYLGVRQKEEADADERIYQSLLTPKAPPAPTATPEAPAPTAPPAMGGRFTQQRAGLERLQGALPAVAADIKASLPELPQAVAGGARDAVVNALDAIVRYSAPSVPGVSEPALGSGVIPAVVPEVAQPETVTGGLARNAAQFLTGFIPLSLAAGPAAGASVLGRIGLSAAQGAAVDMLAFDPKQPRVSNLINDLLPELKNPVTEYLASSPEDTDAEGRLKNALEGLPLGVAADAVLATVKAIKATGARGLASETGQRLTEPLRGEAGAVELPFGPEIPRQLPPQEAAQLAQEARPRVHEMPVEDLQLDPTRFQYKLAQAEGGTTGSLAGVQQYDPNLAGIIQVWTDPADGQTYVVNGHNRVGLAQQHGVDTIPVRELDVATAEEARTIGALTNVAEGRGNAMDAAKLFRDTGMTLEDLKARGIPLRERVATDGLALANLSDALFNDVVQGRLPLERGIIIGARLPDPEQQAKLVQLIAQQTAKGERITHDQTRELADFVAAAPTTQAVQETLFGAEEVQQTLALDKARLAATIRERLAKDQRLFNLVGREEVAERLTAAGNLINIKESQEIGSQAASLLDIFDRLKYRTGPIGDILNQGAGDLHAGGNLRDVSARLYDELTAALPEAIRGAERPDLTGAQAGIRLDQPTAGTTGDVIAAGERTRGARSESDIPIREQRPVVEGDQQADIFGEAPRASGEGAEPPGPPPGGPPGAPPGGGEPPPPPRVPLLGGGFGTPEEAALREAAFESPGRFNPTYQRASTALKNLTARVNVLARETGELITQTRGTQTFGEIGARARELVRSGEMSAERIFNFHPGTILTAEEGLAARHIRDATIRGLDELMTRAANGDDMALSQLANATYLASVVERNVEAASGTEPARALATRRAFSRASGGLPPGMRLQQTYQILDQLRELQGEMSDDLARRVQTSADGIQQTIEDLRGQATGAGKGILDDVAGELAKARAETEPNLLLGTLWETILKGAARAEDQALDPRLLQTILTQVQEQISKAVPEGYLLGGLWDVLVRGATEANANLDPRLLMQFYQSFADETGRRAFLNYLDTTSRRQRYVNALMEAWINGLLSGPQTHAANFLSNALTTFWAIPERAVAAQLHTGIDAGVMKGEATQMLYGLWQGSLDGFSAMAESWRGGERLAGSRTAAELGLDPLQALGATYRTWKQGADLSTGKVETVGAISSELLQLSGAPGQFADWIGHIIRLPGRALQASDEFFKAINYRMEVHAQAFRRATSEGLEGDELARRIAALTAQPSDDIRASAQGFAAYQTFTSELGETGEKFIAFANSHPAVRIILPFIRTPTNIFKYALERTPGLNLLAENVRADLRAGGARRDMALAKTAMGGVTMGTAAALAASGYITGDGPKDPNLRKLWLETHQPYSIRVGGTWYSYNRLDPLGLLFGVAANIAEVSGELPRAELDQLAMAGVLAVMDSFTSKTYLRGIANVMDAIRNPEERGLNFLRGLARSTVPAGLGQLNRAYFDKQLHEVNSLFDEIRARVPGWSDDLPPRRNLWGDPIMLGGGLGPDLISPIYTNPVKEDPVSDELVKQRVSIAMPSKYMGGARPPLSASRMERLTAGVSLNEQEYDDYVRLAGNELKLNGLGLKERLGELIDSDAYQEQTDGPDGGKALLIRNTIRIYREAAQLEVRRLHPELDELIREREAERIEARIPGAEDLPGRRNLRALELELRR